MATIVLAGGNRAKARTVMQSFGSGAWRRSAVGFWLVLLGLLPLPAAHAHELDFQQLQLIWDGSDNSLRGQVVTEPKQFASEGGARASEVLGLLREQLDLEIDGVSCPLLLEVRELWVPAGATLGDVVMVHCALAQRPRTLRVYAGSGLHGLRVTVQRILPEGEVFTDETLVLAGSWSGVYDFAGGWNSGPAGADAARAPDQLPSWALAWRYLRYGVDHILDEGWDHVAFVATLVVGATRLGFIGLILRLTSFTLAHSITLALGALGVVLLPRSVIEPLIALSIALLALLQMFRATPEPRTRPRGTTIKRIPLADLAIPFAFGLLHGQGFASVLIDTGLPVAGLVVALLAFNLGVELGQAIWASLFWLGLRALPASLAPRVLWLCSLGLAALGLYWTWERTLG